MDHFKDRFNEKFWAPKGGVNIQLNDRAMLYGSISRGFKTGGWNSEPLTTLDHFRFNSEFVTSYEMGFKSTAWNNRLRLNSAVYLAKYKDYQVFQFQQTEELAAVLSLTNAGKVTTKGVEVEVSVLPMAGLSISTGLGLIRAKFDEFKDGGGIGIHYDGHKLIDAPEWELNIAIDYRKPLDKLGALVLHGDFFHTDEFFTSPNNNRQTHLADAYHLMNARAGFERDHWKVFLSIRNVTNNLYMRNKHVSVLGTQRAWFGLPRTYTIQWTFKFLK